MALLFSILCSVVLFLGLLLFVPTLLGIDYLQQNGTQKIKIRARILGIPFSFSVPLDKEKKKKARDQEKKVMTAKSFIKTSKDLYHGYKEAEHEAKALLREARDKIACKELLFSIYYGTQNPALTGVLNPAIWTAGSLILKILDSLVSVEKKTLNVYPDFEKSHICLHMKASFQFKLYHAIYFTHNIIRLINIVRSYTITENNEKDGVNDGRASD